MNECDKQCGKQCDYNIINKCRFCYSYKPPGNVDKCCVPTICNETNITISTVENTRTTERSLLLANQNKRYEYNYKNAVNSSITYTEEHNAAITSTLYGQLVQIRLDRYQPYQPYMPPVIPPSVMQLEMNTVNVGVPASFFTIANCKGSQSVTTTDRIIY